MEKKEKAQTLLNILSLDYLENVEGYYGNFNFIEFQGSLYSALYQNSNPIINELFFDLRPAANFKTAATDGLGVDIDGAIPMVPAVILREKPFTMYKFPKRTLQSPDNKSTLKVGALPVGNKGKVLPDPSGQMFMSVMAQTSSTTSRNAGGSLISPDNKQKYQAILDKLDSGIVTEGSTKDITISTLETQYKKLQDNF